MSEQPAKEMRRRIKIDMGELIYAFESVDYERSYFLDLDTGERARLESVGSNLPGLVHMKSFPLYCIRLNCV